MSRRVQRSQDGQAYLMHATAWRETSLILQVFTRHHGAVTMVAKGAKRPYSTLRPVLLAFQPLSLSWTGAGEVKTLSRAEATGLRLLAGRSLMSAWYMNELIVRLLPREDAHPAVFDAYDAALERLSRLPLPGGDEADDAAVPRRTSAAGALRRFEWILLNETGYGLGDAAPDFDDPAGEPALRAALRERLNELLGRPLLTRKVLMDLQGY